MINKTVFDPDHTRTLFVLFPFDVKDQEEVKKLHSGIEAVRFPKRARRWCHIRFKTEELAKQAQKELHKKKVKHGRLKVSQTKMRQQKDLEEKSKKQGFYKLFISNIPEDATKKDIKSAFKTCQSIRIKPPRKDSKGRQAIIVMRSFADAQDVLIDQNSHTINGVPVTVQFTKTVLNFTQKGNKTSVGQKSLNGKSVINHRANRNLQVVGKKKLEDIRAVKRDIQNINNQINHIMQNYKEMTSSKEYSRGTDIEDNMSLNQENIESQNKNLIMQNYKTQTGNQMEQSSDDDSAVDSEQQEGDEESDTENEDMEGIKDQESEDDDEEEEEEEELEKSEEQESDEDEESDTENEDMEGIKDQESEEDDENDEEMEKLEEQESVSEDEESDAENEDVKRTKDQESDDENEDDVDTSEEQESDSEDDEELS